MHVFHFVRKEGGQRTHAQQWQAEEEASFLSALGPETGWILL